MEVTEPMLLGTFITLCTCATLGLMVSVGFIIFHLYHRNNKIVKMSSPHVNLVISVGGLFTCCVCFLYSLDYIAEDDSDSLTLLCQVRPWVVTIAVSFIFSPIAAKTWRVLQIFKYGFAKKVVIRDTRLFAIIMGVVIVDGTLLVLWQVIDNVQYRATAYTETIIGPGNVTSTKTDMDVIRECSCDKQEVWIAVITSWKIVTLATCLYFAWKTRSVSVPCLNDSSNTFIAVFSSVLLTFFTAMITLTLRSNPNAVYILSSVAMVILAVLVQMVMFLPKVRYWWTTPDNTSPRISSTSLKQTLNNRLPWQHSGDVNGNMYFDEGLGDIVDENNFLKRSLLEREDTILELQKHLDIAKDKLLALPQTTETELQQVNDVDTETSSVSDGIYQTLRAPDSHIDRSDLYRIDSTPLSGTDEEILDLTQSPGTEFSRQQSRFSLSIRSESSFVNDFTDIATEVERASMINSGLCHSISRDVERYSATEWVYEGGNSGELAGSLTQSFNLKEKPETIQLYLNTHPPKVNGVYQRRARVRRLSGSSAMSVTPSESVSNRSVDAWSLSREISSLPRDSATPNSQQHADMLRNYSYRHMNYQLRRFRYPQRLHKDAMVACKRVDSSVQLNIPQSAQVRVYETENSDIYSVPNKRPTLPSLDIPTDSFV